MKIYQQPFLNNKTIFRAPKKGGGFTLLEILIAIFIFAIIATTIFASYNSIFNNSGAIDQGIAAYEMAKNCLNRMLVDLASVHVTLYPKYAPPDVDDPPDPYRLTGDSLFIKAEEFPILRFTSLAHLPLSGSMENGIAEIVYYVQDTKARGLVLRRADNLYPYEAFAEKNSDPILCEGIKSLAFTYYDIDGEAHDFWDSDAEAWEYTTPKRIGIKLEIDNNSKSLRFETMAALPVYRKKKENE
jgi:general secretion pathway protein J